jgi:Sulfotransferase family
VSLKRTAGRYLKELPPGVHHAVPESVRRALRHRLGRYYSWEAGFDRQPKPLRDGEEYGPPDFVGIGAQKAGTSWWYRLLCLHPGVTMRASLPKERHYFAPYALEAFDDAACAGYQQWFPRRVGTMTGEWTPDYLCQAWVAPLMAAAAPDTRLLVLLRDPVERVRSRLAQLGGPSVNLGTMMSRLVDGGFYAAQLARWYDHFDAAQILVLQYEQCVADTVGQLDRTYRFVGLDPEFRPGAINREVNAAPGPKTEMPADVRARLADVYASDVAELTKWVPDFDLSLWPNFSLP